MNKTQAWNYVSHIINDALSDDLDIDDALPNARLIGWQCGFEPMFIAVQSYLPNTTLDESEAIELATDYLKEKDWFMEEPTEPDYVF